MTRRHVPPRACAVCGDRFWPRHTDTGKRYKYCSAKCHDDAMRAWYRQRYQDRHDEMLVQHAAARRRALERDPEGARARQREASHRWYAKNRDNFNERQRERYRTKPRPKRKPRPETAARKAYRQRWQQEHRDKMREYCRRWRAKKRAEKTLPLSQRDLF